MPLTLNISSPASGGGFGIDVTRAPYSADPTGVVDATSAFSAAHDAAVASGSYLTAPPKSVFKVGAFSKTTSPVWLADDVTIVLASGAFADEGPWIQFAGSLGTEYPLTANTAANDDTVVVSPANAVALGLAVGDLVIVGSEACVNITDRPTEHIGQSAEVKSVNTGTGVITLRETLHRPYLTADTAMIQKVTPLENPRIEGFTFQNYTPLTGKVIQLAILNARDVRVQTKHVDSDSVCCWLVNCFRFRSYTDIVNAADDLAAARYGYGLCADAATSHGLAEIHANKCRHAFTTNNNGYGNHDHGEPTDIVVTGEATACTAAAFDTHETGWDITFKGCNAVGNFAPGFQIRGSHVTIDGGISGHNTSGVQFSYPNAGARVNGLYIHNTHRNGTIATEYGGSTVSGGAFRFTSPGTLSDVVIQGCRIKNIFGSVLRFGSNADNPGGVAGLTFCHNIIEDFATGQQSGEKAVFNPQQTVTGLRAFGNKVKSSAVDKYIFYGSGADSHGNQLWGSDNKAWDNDWGNVPEFQGGQEAQVKTWNNSKEGVKYRRKYVQTFGATPTFDLSLCPEIEMVLTGNVTASTFSGGTDQQEFRLTLIQDATGSRTFVWPAAGTTIVWKGNGSGGGSAPTLLTAANSRDSFLFKYDSTANKLYELGRLN